MGSIPPTSPKTQEQQIAQLKNTIAKLQAENERIKSAYTLLRTENHQLLSQLDWQKRLFANPAYSFSEKCTILVSKPLLLASPPNEQGLSHVPLYKVAQALGTSPKTVGRNFSKLSETTVDIQRNADRNENEEGQWKTDVYIAFSEQLLTRPDTTTRLTPRNQGGKRVKRCKDCGNENLLEQKTIICAKCGSEQSKTLRPVNPPAGQNDGQEDEKLAPPCSGNSRGTTCPEEGWHPRSRS